MATTTPRTYTLPSEVAHFIDSLPKRERSKFVSSQLSRAIVEQSKKDALKALKAIVPVKSDGRTSVQLLEESRKNRNEQLIGNITKNN